MLTKEGVAAEIARVFWDIVTGHEPRMDPTVEFLSDYLVVVVRPGAGGEIPVWLEERGQATINGITFIMIPPVTEIGIVWVVQVIDEVNLLALESPGLSLDNEIVRLMTRKILAKLGLSLDRGTILIDTVRLALLT